MKNLVQRAITSAGIVIVFSGAVILGPYTFLILVFSINLFALAEFYRLHNSLTVLPRTFAGIILSACMSISAWLVIFKIYDYRIFLLNIPVIFLICVHELYRKAEKPFHNLAFTYLGIILITLPLILFTAIAFLPLKPQGYHPYVMLGCLFIIWTSDTAAYFFGKNFGRHPLFKRISPGKTWEGSIGGILCAALTAYLVSRWSYGNKCIRLANHCSNSCCHRHLWRPYKINDEKKSWN